MTLQDQYPLDWTGYGPAGTGGAPTVREMQQQQRNVYATTRSAQAAAMIDPVVQAAALKAVRAIIGQSEGVAAQRRAMFNSSTGQAAMDAMMLGRVTGMLGEGNPVTAASNISQGVAGGGFRLSIGGLNSYGSGPVSGTGPVAEHVSMSFMKKIMRDMYGNTGDSGRMNGFNSEEASQVFNRLARRGVIGTVAKLQRGADIATRLDAASENEIDPSLQAEMRGIKLTGSTEQDRIASLQKYADASDNRKLKSAINNLIKAPDALIMNKNEADRIGTVVKKITEGLASLSDVYEGLSASELQDKLEAVSGMKITNSAQAAKARAMVNELRGAAVVSGMDPRAFMDWSAATQAQLRGGVAQAIGADPRHSSMVTSMTANMHHSMMVESALTAKQASRAVSQARELGVNMADAPDAMAIYEDDRQGRMQFLDRYAGVTMAQGGIHNLTGDARTQAEKLLKEFKGTTDAGKRSEIETQMQSLWSAAYSRPGQEVDFAGVMSSRSGKRMLEDAFSNKASSREMQMMAARGRNAALNMNPMSKMLSAGGVTDADGISSQLLNDVGLEGMGDLLRASKNDNKADRMKMQRDMLSRAGMSGASADKFLSQLFDAEGRVKNEDSYKGAMSFLNDSNYKPGMSTYDQAALGESRLAMIGADSNRRKLGPGDKGIDFSSIATAIATGGMKNGISDPESLTMMLEAMSKSGIPLPQTKDASGNMVSAGDQYATGIDFSKGLTSAGMARLSKLHGKELNLHKKLNFGSMEDLIAATSGEDGNSKNLLADAINMLQTDKDYIGLNLAGDVGSMSAITDSAKDSLDNSGELRKKGRQMGGAMMIARSMGLDAGAKNSIMQEIEAGKTPSMGMFEPGKYRRNFTSGLPGADRMMTFLGLGEPIDPATGKPVDRMKEGLSRIMGFSSLVGLSKGEDLASLASLNEGGVMTSKLDAQIKELEKKAAAGEANVDYKVDGADRSSPITAVIEQLNSTIQKLNAQQAEERGSALVNEMIVTNVKVVGNFDPGGK